jgi:hypothetical protein
MFEFNLRSPLMISMRDGLIEIDYMIQLLETGVESLYDGMGKVCTQKFITP